MFMLLEYNKLNIKTPVLIYFKNASGHLQAPSQYPELILRVNYEFMALKCILNVVYSFACQLSNLFTRYPTIDILDNAALRDPCVLRVTTVSHGNCD